MPLLNLGSKAPGLWTPQDDLHISLPPSPHGEIAQYPLDRRLLGLQKKARGGERKKFALVKD